MPARFESDRDERYTHRLEAFSDIVIAFSLAQVSLNFNIPARATEVYTNPAPLTAFAVTFSVVAIFWWSHHRLFEDYFVPRRSTVTLNFVVLALLVWLIYQLQLFVHFEGTPGRDFAVESYVVTYGLVYLLHTVLLVECIRIRWAALDEDQRRRGIGSAGRLLGIVLGTAIGLAVCVPLGIPEVSLFGIFAGQAVWRIVSPPVLRHFLSKPA